jgi:hypothetical protein
MNQELSLAIVVAVVTLLWNLYGFAGNFFEHYWGGSRRLPVTLISYLVNALLLAALGLVGVKQLPAARVLAFAGLVMAVWSLGGVAVEAGVVLPKFARGADVPRLNLPEPSALLGALVPMITGALTAVLAWRASLGAA